MTTEKNGTQDMKAEEEEIAELASEAQEKKPVSSLLVFMSLVLSIIAVGFAAYNYRSINTVKTDSTLTEKLDQFDRSLDEVNRSITSVQSQQQQFESSVASLVDDQERNAQSLQALYNDQDNDDIGWSLAEVEHLINIANLRLTLEQDIDTALAALQAADNRLALLGDPGLFNVRRLLSAEMNALRSVTPVDITGLSLYLTDMAGRVKSLPLKAAAVTEDLNTRASVDQGLPAWKQLLLNLWFEFKGMFTITRIGNNASATLLPDEKYFLYQNLRLQLESARLAVIRRDTASLHESLEVIRTWLNDYFNIQDSGVINIIQASESMANLELEPLLPDVSSSLEALRSYMNNRNTDNPASDTDLP